eukprot:TRINITY_DN15491_c0_g1_i1.p1 TRINITY_DN15491_c0_g1~~TRINITY_DN15491_c0_g1_i1.p1  ORF type:complete len:349 (-),score=-17.45 TRINITY_DN15491_c0_g1_i1:97-1143(-)
MSVAISSISPTLLKPSRGLSRTAFLHADYAINLSPGKKLRNDREAGSLGLFAWSPRKAIAVAQSAAGQHSSVKPSPGHVQRKASPTGSSSSGGSSGSVSVKRTAGGIGTRPSCPGRADRELDLLESWLYGADRCRGGNGGSGSGTCGGGRSRTATKVASPGGVRKAKPSAQTHRHCSGSQGDGAAGGKHGRTGMESGNSGRSSTKTLTASPTTAHIAGVSSSTRVFSSISTNSVGSSSLQEPSFQLSKPPPGTQPGAKGAAAAFNSNPSTNLIGENTRSLPPCSGQDFAALPPLLRDDALGVGCSAVGGCASSAADGGVCLPVVDGSMGLWVAGHGGLRVVTGDLFGG